MLGLEVVDLVVGHAGLAFQQQVALEALLDLVRGLGEQGLPFRTR